MYARMPVRFFITAVFACSMFGFAGCEAPNANSTAKHASGFIDSSITEFHSLGWTGVLCHPLNVSLSFADPENNESSISPGGLVVTKVIDDSPAAVAGLQTGDVIVGIADEWVPIKDDPTLNVFKQIEDRVAAGDANTEIIVFRSGQLENVMLKNMSDPLGASRSMAAARSGLKYLTTLQNEDGSFGSAEDSSESKLMMTSVAGLAFLSVGDDEFKLNVDSCKSFVGAKLDEAMAAAESDQSDESKMDSKPGVIMMKMTSVEMEPLAAAYVLQFVSESGIQLMDRKWMPRVMGLIGGVSKSQSESGSWGATNSSEDEDKSAIDISATHTTNQILLALGMLERHGMQAQPEVITKACAYLKEQRAARASGRIDRRVKASLVSGTAAALAAINCQKSDTTFKEVVADGMDKLSERHTSPRLALSGSLSAAILAKQTPDGWSQFYDEMKYWLASIQLPDGTFNSMPKVRGDADSSSRAIHLEDHPAMAAAHYCLLLSMPKTKLDKLTGKTTTPMMAARDSDGKKSKGAATVSAEMPTNLPAGAKVMRLDLGDLEGGDLQEAIRKKLEEQGIDMGDAEIKGLDSVPSSSKKKD